MKNKWLLLGFASFLSACSNPPAILSGDLVGIQKPLSPHPGYRDYKHKARELNKLVQWDVEGKMAVYTATENNNGNFTWRRRADHFELLITGPLGQGRLHIEGTPDMVIATTPAEQHQAKDIAALFLAQFGWHFPMPQLRYWVRGIASPNTDAEVVYNDDGQLAFLRQADWDVTFAHYSKINGLPMPDKIIMQGNNIRIKLILNRWANLYPLPRLNHTTSALTR